MSSSLEKMDALARRYIGVGAGGAAVGLALLAIAGGAVGLLFPKYEATALLQFPEPAKDAEALKRFESNHIELATYKRVSASYESAAPLASYLNAVWLSGQPASERLLKQAEAPGFWPKTASPVLPFSRRDQKEFGDIKEAAGTTVLGLELTANARTGGLASEMLTGLAGYYTNAFVRERVRSWILAGKFESQSQLMTLRSEILKAELDIELSKRRGEDLKALLARYPDSSKLDTRQVVSVNAAEGGERYLSPLAQLVGVETSVSQKREAISRLQRDLLQREVLAKYFASANELIDREPDAGKLLAGLRALASTTFAHAREADEWNKEAAYRVSGALDNVEVMRGQFGVRNGIRVGEVMSRSPARLAGLGFALGLALIGAIAFLRAAVLSTVREPAVTDDNTRQD